ncbi:MAG: TIGR01459 family HAD-type hydrolase, partial [Dongiaceae bacterium]
MSVWVGGLRTIINNYDALILDLWGTVHNGAQPLPGVVEALQQLKNLNKKVIMLSNAPRRIDLIESQLKEMNITPDLYFAVHSSGEETYLYLRDEAKLGQKFYHQGMHPHQSVYRDLKNYQRVETIDEADFILATGVAHIEDKIESVIPILNQGLSRKLPL